MTSLPRSVSGADTLAADTRLVYGEIQAAGAGDSFM